jgi:hypothetical protein
LHRVFALSRGTCGDAGGVSGAFTLVEKLIRGDTSGGSGVTLRAYQCRAGVVLGQFSDTRSGCMLGLHGFDC